MTKPERIRKVIKLMLATEYETEEQAVMAIIRKQEFLVEEGMDPEAAFESAIEFMECTLG